MAIGESRTELLHWLNSTFRLPYSRVEQCGTGAAYCQIMDAIHGDVPMAKVKFENPLSDYDARQNMKILQAAFNRHGISKHIEVERLIKCRLQDNLELLQWFKRYWTETGASAGNLGARSENPRAVSSDRIRNSSERIRSSGDRARSASDKARVASSEKTPATSIGMRSRGSGSFATASSGRVSGGSSTGEKSRRVVSASSAGDESARAYADLRAAREEAAELRLSAESLETERNFYFNKLREIEILTQSIQDSGAEALVLELVGQIQEILYSTEKGFEAPDGDTESF
ncbi:hypothetical protein E0198_001874 [Clavispora lusitaniae]|nr:hypothetical protein E0198_001874 [Clavispora lusitaniae]